MLRDCDQAAVERANYLRYLAQGRKGYTEDGFASAEPFFGVCVPRTSLGEATAEQVWDHHERRWAIETHCDWLKNGMGLRGLCQRDYCRAQGLAFVCLVASLVRRELADLVGGRLPGHTVDEAQLDACVDFGTASEEWWKNTLLGYEEMPGYPVQITGEMEMA